MIKHELQKRILSSIILIPITIFFIFQGPVFFAFFLSIFFLASSYEWVKMNKKDSFKALGIFYLFLTCYLTYLFSQNFFFQFLLVLVVCIFTDLGGYIFGKIFKGPKLTKLSPNKTYAGVLGGYTCSIILFFTILKINLIDKQYFINFLIFILLISSISQFGDILVSYFKRLSKIKDTGNIIPGHGGLLDRIDGVIFAFPASYLIVLIDYFNFFL